MRDNELLENLIDAEGSFTNDYLPGEVPYGTAPITSSGSISCLYDVKVTARGC